MRYDRNAILKSERAYQILRQIATKEKGSYPTEISEEIGANRSAVSEIISQLNELELIEKKDRDSRAQYYQLDWKGFYQFWTELLNENFDKNTQGLQEILEEDTSEKEGIKKDFNNCVEKEPDISEIIRGKIDERGLIARFFLNYSRHYFEYFGSDKTLEDMLIIDMPKAIEDGLDLTTQVLPKIEEKEGEKEFSDNISTMMNFLKFSTPNVNENPGARAFAKELLEISEEQLFKAEEEAERSVENQ